MHLPFMQVAAEIINGVASELGCLLDIETPTALGHAVMLFEGALRRVPDGELPSAHAEISGPTAAKLVARLAGYRGDPEAFVDACETCRPALLERTPNGVRIRGLDRYDITISSAGNRSGHARAAADARWKRPKNGTTNAQSMPEQCPSNAQSMPGACPADAQAMPGNAKTQTQTQTQKSLEVTSVVNTDADVVPNRGLPSPPKFSGGGFFAWTQEQRLAEGLAQETAPHPQKLSQFYSAAMMELSGDDDRLRATYAAFADDPYWGKQKPQWPFPAFMKQWRDFVPRKQTATGT